MNARDLAARVLVRVFDDRAFASAALDAELDRYPGIDPRDRGLATELVYGVLRTHGFLLGCIEDRSNRGLPDESLVVAHLLIAAYSLFFLDRVPAFAVVSEAVNLVRASHPDAAGYVNAICRGLGRAVEERGRPKLIKALVDGAPGWLRGALRRSIGRKSAEQFLESASVVPALSLAMAKEENRTELVEAIKAAALTEHPSVTVDEGALSARSIAVRGAGDPELMAGFGERFIVQEEGAQLIALALGARAGERVLDACAGRGNKSWFLKGEVGPAGEVVAVDVHPAKIEALLRGPAGKLGVTGHAVDWTLGDGDLPDDFDRALVDAPCSGIGTLRRRPEIALFRTQEDLEGLAALQIAIVRRVAGRVRSGGRLLFAVCSVLQEECEQVVAALTSGPHEGITLDPSPIDAAEVQALSQGASQLRLLPHQHGTDGYFLACFVVRKQ